LNWKCFAFVPHWHSVNYITNSISYRFYRHCCRVLFVLPVLALAPTVFAQSEPHTIPYQTASDLLSAASKIRLSTDKLVTNLQYCGEKFPHLQDGAIKARQQWYTRNQAVLAQATQISTHIIENIRQSASPFTAEKMALDMDSLVSTDVNAFMLEFKEKGRKEQHYLCNRLILSIPDGDHDLVTQNSTETKLLLEFKP
jgi:hypothetical protein